MVMRWLIFPERDRDRAPARAARKAAKSASALRNAVAVSSYFKLPDPRLLRTASILGYIHVLWQQWMK
jgi:hypothetical protein